MESALGCVTPFNSGLDSNLGDLHASRGIPFTVSTSVSLAAGRALPATLLSPGYLAHHLGILAETSRNETIEFLCNKVRLRAAVVAAVLCWLGYR
jgi:hypothetical protein